MIDFEGFVDGVAFEGGKGENHPLEIGSHSFIDTFEDQLVGKNAGDEVDVNVTFPEKYQAADLAGKPALFKVKIHEVKAKELPELNDEFAQDVSEFNTLEEYKEDLKKHLEVQKEDEAKRTKEDEAIQKIIDKSTMEIPEAMIKTQCENMVNEFAQRLAQSGLSMEQYMQFSGLTLDKLEEQVRPEAETRIKSSLVLEQIAKDENIEVSEEEIDAEIEKMAKAYGMEADKLKEYMGDAEKESMKRDISVTKAVDLVMENVKERAKAKTKKEKPAKTLGERLDALYQENNVKAKDVSYFLNDKPVSATEIQALRPEKGNTYGVKVMDVSGKTEVRIITRSNDTGIRIRGVHGEIEAFPISACLQTEVILGHIGASLKLIISVITIYTVAI